MSTQSTAPIVKKEAKKIPKTEPLNWETKPRKKLVEDNWTPPPPPPPKPTKVIPKYVPPVNIKREYRQMWSEASPPKIIKERAVALVTQIFEKKALEIHTFWQKVRNCTSLECVGGQADSHLSFTSANKLYCSLGRSAYQPKKIQPLH